jgi:ABC-type amino acid transport substrate-binding protein
MLDALHKGKVDYLLIDSLTATYWEANSSGQFVSIGDAYIYGNGFGIAVNQNDPLLLESLNRALVDFQNSPEYKTLCNQYLNRF